MKANELMIGDWVSQSNGNAVKIDWIKTGEYGYYDKYGKMEIACTPLLEPIPLTPEILEKNGFVYEKDFEAFIDEENYIRINIPNESDGAEVSISYMGSNFGEITFYPAYKEHLFVHELQHVFRLCGLNDLADNFKI